MENSIMNHLLLNKLFLIKKILNIYKIINNYSMKTMTRIFYLIKHKYLLEILKNHIKINFKIN